MTIFQEVEKIISELPPEKASSLKIWLNDFQAARCYKQLKAYTKAFKTLDHFEDSNSDASWN